MGSTFGTKEGAIRFGRCSASTTTPRKRSRRGSWWERSLRLELEDRELKAEHDLHPLNEDDLYVHELLGQEVEHVDGRMPVAEAQLLLQHMLSELMFSPEGRRRLTQFKRRHRRRCA